MTSFQSHKNLNRESTHFTDEETEAQTYFKELAWDNSAGKWLRHVWNLSSLTLEGASFISSP